MYETQYDYTRLRERIRSSGNTLGSLAAKIGCTEGTLCNKLHQKYSFDQLEMEAICKALGISPFDIGIYFFAN